MTETPKDPKHPTDSKQIPSSKANTSSTENPSKWIRIDKPFPFPAYIREALQKLDDAGHIAYVVGGSVRDFLLGREGKDHDIATSADPDELCRLFPSAITVGKSFGVIKVPVESNLVFEIATFREDVDYKDHRHPTGVLFSGPQEDAKRRDFTINALFYDPKSSRILDTVNGLEDLKSGVIRAIGNPHLRFREDALRLLRAVRFTTALDFRLDPKTEDAMRSQARLITRISGERVRDEFNLIFKGPRPAEAILMLSNLGILTQLFPELEPLKSLPQAMPEKAESTVWKHTIRVLETLAKQALSRSPVLSWAVLLHEVGKPVAFQRNGGKNFNGHEIDGAQLARKICDRMKIPRVETDAVAWLIENHLRFKDVFQMREATLVRFLREPHFEELLALHKADAMSTDGNLVYYEFCNTRFQELKAAPETPKLLSGDDLIQLGFKPGPKFTEILRTIEDLALEKKLTSKEEALEYVIKHFVG